LPTELLYLTDSYLRKFTANVISSKDQSAILDRTAFYPGGGGQPCDTGELQAAERRIPVVSVEKEAGEVVHRLGGQPLEIGSTVDGTISWETRYRYMRFHSALHVLCGVVFKLFGSLVTGGQIYLDKARMDFDLEDLTPARVTTIEAESNKIIGEGRRFNVRMLPREEAFKIPDLIRTKINLLPAELTTVRVIEIEGVDMQADGGTHVSNTREIGSIRVVKVENKGRFNKRMEIALGPVSVQS